MRQADFLARLERGLRALSEVERMTILSDYQRYFADGAAAGRDESEVAASLGNPTRLAAELRIGHDLQSWRAGGGRSPFRTLRTVLLLLCLDSLVWLPALLAGVVLLVALGTGFVALIYGLFTLAVEPFDDPLGGIGAALLRGIGWLAAGIGLLLVCNVAIQGLASLLARRRRAINCNEVSP